MASGLGEVRQASVRGEAFLAGLGFVLAGVGFLVPALLGARVVSLSLPARLAASVAPVLVGGLLVYYAYRRVALRTGWTPLLEGVGGWLFFSLIASVFFAHSGWTMPLQWVRMVIGGVDDVAAILYAVLAAILGLLMVFIAASSLAPSVYLARNLFRASTLMDHAMFVYKVSSVLSALVYPLVGVAAALAAIGGSLIASPGQVAVRASVMEAR